MTIKLFDLAAADPLVRFSPNCWRVRMTLAHKGLAVETIPWRFTEKSIIAPSGQSKAPVIQDRDRWVADSWSIAKYLDKEYPDSPVFGNAESEAYALFIKNWIETQINPGVTKQIIIPLFEMLAEKDKDYFRTTREKALGTTLEAHGADAAGLLPSFRKSLEPLRRTVSVTPFVSGEAPTMTDYICFGTFQWARTSAPHDLLEPNDPIFAWRERMLDLYDGLARKTPPKASRL